MPRRKQYEPRTRQFNVGLTAREHERLHARAAALGMRPVDYGRAQLFTPRRVSAAQAASAHHLDPLFHTQLSRLGNNLNQITRKLNTLGLPPPATLEQLLRDIRGLLATRNGDGP